MNTKEIEALESYFKTENEHWNTYAFKMLCEVLQKDVFDNPETPLELFSMASNNLPKESESPLKALQNFGSITEKLNTPQKLFIYEWVLKYFKNSEFDNANTTEIQDLLKIQINHMKNEVKDLSENNKPLVRNMRDSLKEFVQKELEQMPETFKDLEPMQKLTVLSKLMPYVFPKVETISCKEDEPFTFD